MRKATANRVRLGDIIVSPSGMEIEIVSLSKNAMTVVVSGFEMNVENDYFKSYFNGFYIKPQFKDYLDKI